MSLYLVDGHALAYRSYYAFIRQPLVNSKGEETSAVFGFLNTVLNLIEKYDPRYLGVVFDARGKTFRHEMYEAYKATRSETPESLIEQLPVIFALLEAMNIAQFSLEGYEADDIIATFARRFQNGTSVKIVSGDKDLLQLVSEAVHIIRPGRSTVLEQEIDPEALVELMGLRPEQIVDYLSLIGDTSDNVPGVRGIGQKTALKLLETHGSLEALYENVESVGSKSVKKKLLDGRDDAFLSRELITLDAKVPIEARLGDFERGEMKTETLRSLLSDLEFDRQRKQIFGSAGGKVAEGGVKDERGYRRIENETQLADLSARLAASSEFAVDVEATGVDPMRAVLAGISVAIRPGEAWYVPVSSKIGGGELELMPPSESPGLALPTVQTHLGPVLSSIVPSKIGQNIKYDAVVLENHGMPLRGISFDTMIASYCLDPSRRSHGLDALVLDLLGHQMIPFSSLFDTRAKQKDIRSVPLERVTPYACEDADYTLRLKQVFEPLLAASTVQALFSDVEMPLEEVLMRMEMTGVRVDTAFMKELSDRYARETAETEEKIYRLVGERFNINSTPKLREVLFDKLHLKPARRTKTGYSTDGDVLSALRDQHEVPALILHYRQWVKLKNTYIDAIPRLVHPRTGRVHTSYNQAVASTGRLSSSDPNLQNIPIRTAEGREIRKAFVSGGDDWILLDADYSQIELRILAHLSRDGGLIAAFEDDADVHRRTAAKILKVEESQVSDEMRARAKTVNFGIVYGMGARGLAQSLEIDVGEAKQFIDDYFRSYPGVKRFIDDTIEAARRDKVVGTLLGRVRQLPDIDSSNGRARSFSERIAVNTPVQGTAADIIKLAMLDVDREIRRRGLRSRMILQVHDELLFDVHEPELQTMEEVVRNSMQSAMALDVPLKVDMGVGRNWLEAH